MTIFFVVTKKWFLVDTFHVVKESIFYLYARVMMVEGWIMRRRITEKIKG
jgi:hypothetical protein